MDGLEIFCKKCKGVPASTLLVAVTMYGTKVRVAVKCHSCGSVEQVSDASIEVLTSTEFAAEVKGWTDRTPTGRRRSEPNIQNITPRGAQTGRTKMGKSNIKEVEKKGGDN